MPGIPPLHQSLNPFVLSTVLMYEPKAMPLWVSGFHFLPVSPPNIRNRALGGGGRQGSIAKPSSARRGARAAERTVGQLLRQGGLRGKRKEDAWREDMRARWPGELWGGRDGRSLGSSVSYLSYSPQPVSWRRDHLGLVPAEGRTSHSRVESISVPHSLTGPTLLSFSKPGALWLRGWPNPQTVEGLQSPISSSSEECRPHPAHASWQ